jgi:hypothetical protein
VGVVSLASRARKANWVRFVNHRFGWRNHREAAQMGSSFRNLLNDPGSLGSNCSCENPPNSGANDAQQRGLASFCKTWGTVRSQPLNRRRGRRIGFVLQPACWRSPPHVVGGTRRNWLRFVNAARRTRRTIPAVWVRFVKRGNSPSSAAKPPVGRQIGFVL